MTRIVMKSKVGSDGVLHLSLPVGMREADQEVQVTVESVAAPKPLSQAEWSAVCPVCASFDTLGWGTPHGAAIVSLAAAPVKKPVPVKIPDERAGIVSLPRPPDDPGPGGVEY